MASIKFTPQDYTSTLAMLNHEGANGILALLKAGRADDAMGYVSGLIDTWNNRAAARGIAPWEMMNKPNQISFWEPDKIQSKANALDPRIKDLADAYLSARANGAAAAHPSASFYLNKDLVEATPSYGTKWKNWYDPGTVVSAYGDKRGGGRGSLETQFVQNDDEYKVPEYSFSFDPSLKLSPKTEAQNVYNSFAKVPVGMGYDPSKALNTGSTGLNDLDVSQGVAPGMIGDSGRVVETGNPYGFTGTDTSAGAAPGSLSPALDPYQPRPGDYAFSGADTSGNVGNGALNPALTPYQPAPGQFDFAQGTDVSGGAQPGTMNPGLVPGDLAFGGKFDAAQYLAANPDVAASADYGNKAWQHYLQFGLNEGRAIDTRGDKFDGKAYLAANPDVAADASYGLDPLRHFRDFGLGEGRAAQIIGPDGTVQSAQSFAQGLTIGPQQTGTIGPTQAPTIGPSGIFDAAAYLRNNPDVAADAYASANPLAHYLRFGGDEGRIIDDNGDKFDAKTYEAQNADVLASGMDPLLHYVRFGQAEGRMAPIIGPDGSVRLVSNLGLASPVSQDLATQLIQAEEAQRRGPSASETGLTIGPQGTAPTIGAAGLSPTIGPQNEVTAQNFDGQAYKAANPDVAASGIDPWTHYSQMGRYEGRQAPTLSNPYNFTDANVSGGVGNGSFGHFDGSAYLQANPDVARAGMNPLQHYLQYGFSEGRAIDPAGHAVAKNFDGNAYLQANPDVARSGLDPLAHFLNFGAAEGRAAPTGSNPYQFSAFNVSQGAGPTGNGSFGTGIGQGLSLTPAQTIGAPAPTQTIGALQVPTIGAGPAVNAAQGIGSYGFSNANVGGALGASPQSFGSLYGTSNLGMDIGQSQPQAQTGGIGEFGFSGANVGGFDVNGFGGAPAPQASGGEAYGPPTFSSNFNPQSSQNAYLDSQVNAANASNAALDAFNPAIRTGMFTSSTGDPGIYKAAADYNVATLAINQANLAKPPAAAAAPVNVPRVAQGAFAPAPFFGRW